MASTGTLGNLSALPDSEALAIDLIRFRITCEKISAIAHQHGFSVKPYRTPECSVFAKLAGDARKSALQQSELYLKSISNDKRDFGGGSVQKELLHAALVCYGLTLPDGADDLLREESIVEIYNNDGLQIWRNFNFFTICSYTLEEIFSVEWFVRYERDLKATKKCMTEVQRVMDLSQPAYFEPNVGEHATIESLSEKKLVVRARFYLLARLQDQDQQATAWLAAAVAHVVGPLEEVGSPFLTIRPPQPSA